MKTNRLFAFAAAVALVVAVTSAAVVWAQARTDPGTHVRFGFIRALARIGRQLNLTDQQKEQIKGIVRSHKADIKALVDQRFAARKALRDAVAGGDSTQIASAARQWSDVQVKATQLRARIRAAIFGNVLQPDQRAKAEQLESRFEQRASRRHQRIDAFIDGF